MRRASKRGLCWRVGKTSSLTFGQQAPGTRSQHMGLCWRKANDSRHIGSWQGRCNYCGRCYLMKRSLSAAGWDS
jgi:hypothetical protein